MPLTLLSLLALALVVALIKALHVLQVKKSREIADQSAPLPPLPENSTTGLRTDDAPGITPDLPLQATPGTWQDEVKMLRDAGQFQQALTLCNRQYPKMLAFRQTMITLRRQIKDGQEQPERSLADIYRTALLADLAKTSRENTDSAHTRPAELPNIQDPQQYWAQIGYEKLDLLTKTDRALLITHWGQPDAHGHVSTLLTPAGNNPQTDTSPRG